jgi:hypothetical protein
MNLAEIQLHYNRQYRDLGFERTGLFMALRKTYRARRVVYIGSSIHVTPSFVFQNTTYVDDSDLAREFFTNRRDLISYIDSRKVYRPRPQLAYLPLNYEKETGKLKNQFDLALSLFSPHSLGPATVSVKKGGLILYLPLPSVKPPADVKLKLGKTGLVTFSRGRYRFVHSSDWEIKPRSTSLRYVTGNRFVENNTYYVFTRL